MGDLEVGRETDKISQSSDAQSLKHCQGRSFQGISPFTGAVVITSVMHVRHPAPGARTSTSSSWHILTTAKNPETKVVLAATPPKNEHKQDSLTRPV